MQVDFRQDVPGAARLINDWVDAQTKNRIRNLIADDALDADTRLVLAIHVEMTERETEVLERLDAAGSRFRLIVMH